MHMQSNIETRVMANVGVIYAVRRALSATALKSYALVASLVALWQLTWVHKVFANWAQVGLGGTWQFVSYAVVHTHLATQLSLAVLALAGVSLTVDVIRSLRMPQTRYSPL